ncbi:MAG TPA: hypothetical protein DEG88_16400 [Propionibacteriaceae bacterium]|nr:hypothetical protein [Propionibacteriaceae bacterium]HBY24786.1 hypothetical protein [Propionibacteriaceae bacterium]
MDYTENSLRASIRALETVIAPAVAAAGDAQAQDQLGLVIDALRFLQTRLADLPTRAGFTLRTTLSLATQVHALAESAAPTAAGVLDAALAEAQSVHDRLGFDTAEVDAATAALAEGIRDAMSILAEVDDPAVQSSLAAAVLTSETRRIEADRAWFVPMGFDPHPESIVDLKTALSA